ncbi:MAG: archease [PVC group bacterium]|nr:archease [PVC group bacterium]
MLNPYEFFEHTADIGIKAFGRDREELFMNAAWGMFFLIAELKIRTQQDYNNLTTIAINVRANNLEELLFSWLSELLSLSDAKRLMASRIQIKEFTETTITADVSFDKLEPKKYNLKTEIKAVTCHKLKIEAKDQYFQAEVVFDI